jgi:hypothetical protein
MLTGDNKKVDNKIGKQLGRIRLHQREIWHFFYKHNHTFVWEKLTWTITDNITEDVNAQKNSNN